MSLLKEIPPIITNMESLHINDIKVYDYWDQLIEILTRNEEETIQFFEENNDENIIAHIAGIFPDLSSNLQSTKFIDALEKLHERFPKLNLKVFIQGAKERLFDTE